MVSTEHWTNLIIKCRIPGGFPACHSINGRVFLPYAPRKPGSTGHHGKAMARLGIVFSLPRYIAENAENIPHSAHYRRLDLDGELIRYGYKLFLCRPLRTLLEGRNPLALDRKKNFRLPFPYRERFPFGTSLGYAARLSIAWPYLSLMVSFTNKAQWLAPTLLHFYVLQLQMGYSGRPHRNYPYRYTYGTVLQTHLHLVFRPALHG